jgi:peptide/nickel transport system permease protein
MSLGWRVPTRLVVGAALLAVLTGAAILGPWLTPDPTAVLDPQGARLLAPGSSRFLVARRNAPPLAATAVERDGSTWRIERGGETMTLPADVVTGVKQRRFPLGTDAVGRDVLARLLSGGRISLAVGGLALVLALGAGILIGVVAGWSGGVVDAVLMRLVDALLAVPLLFLLLLLTALFRPSLALLILLLGFASWMGVARLTRGQILSLREREFILAARGAGASPARIAVVHLIPNSAGPLAQDAALRLGDLILLEASLSFLGLGVQPPTPSWGSMVAEGGTLLGSAWWLVLFPGAAVALTVIAAALLADGIGSLASRD